MERNTCPYCHTKFTEQDLQIFDLPLPSITSTSPKYRDNETDFYFSDTASNCTVSTINNRLEDASNQQSILTDITRLGTFVSEHMNSPKPSPRNIFSPRLSARNRRNRNSYLRNRTSITNSKSRSGDGAGMAPLSPIIDSESSLISGHPPMTPDISVHIPTAAGHNSKPMNDSKPSSSIQAENSIKEPNIDFKSSYHGDINRQKLVRFTKLRDVKRNFLRNKNISKSDPQLITIPSEASCDDDSYHELLPIENSQSTLVTTNLEKPQMIQSSYSVSAAPNTVPLVDNQSQRSETSEKYSRVLELLDKLETKPGTKADSFVNQTVKLRKRLANDLFSMKVKDRMSADLTGSDRKKRIQAVDKRLEDFNQIPTAICTSQSVQTPPTLQQIRELVSEVEDDTTIKTYDAISSIGTIRTFKAVQQPQLYHIRNDGRSVAGLSVISTTPIPNRGRTKTTNRQLVDCFSQRNLIRGSINDLSKCTAADFYEKDEYAQKTQNSNYANPRKKTTGCV